MRRTIIHVDMDAFFAAVEVRDNPDLIGKPLIIGALPHERGVVSTCSYEARKFGVRSAMSISEAYRRCPNGIYMRPNFRKYTAASDKIHEVWSSYTDLIEYVSLDEGFLDVTGSAHLFNGAENIGYEIKNRTKKETGLTCSVGIGYSMMSAKLASEEKKPDGFFEIANKESLKNLILNRSVRIIYGVGIKTAAILRKSGIVTVKDIYENREFVKKILGNQGNQIVLLADGFDCRKVIPFAEQKSIGSEQTFQHDTSDVNYLKDVLLLIANELSYTIRRKNTYCQTVTLKITYANMEQITRSKTSEATNRAEDIYKNVLEMLNKIEKKSVRLIGISLSNLLKTAHHQLTFEDTSGNEQKEKLDDVMFDIQQKYGGNIIKKGNVMDAEKRLNKKNHSEK